MEAELFLDEVHRFNRTQQDALLPWVEEGVLVLIGATTENPYFEVNSPLLSRSLLFRLDPLPAAAVRTVLQRGLDALGAKAEDDARTISATGPTATPASPQRPGGGRRPRRRARRARRATGRRRGRPRRPGHPLRAG